MLATPEIPTRSFQEYFWVQFWRSWETADLVLYLLGVGLALGLFVTGWTAPTDLKDLWLVLVVFLPLFVWRIVVTPWRAYKAWETDWKKKWFQVQLEQGPPFIQEFDSVSEGLNTVAIKSYRLRLISSATLRHVRAEIKSIEPCPLAYRAVMPIQLSFSNLQRDESLAPGREVFIEIFEWGMTDSFLQETISIPRRDSAMVNLEMGSYHFTIVVSGEIDGHTVPARKGTFTLEPNEREHVAFKFLPEGSASR